MAEKSGNHCRETNFWQQAPSLNARESLLNSFVRFTTRFTLRSYEGVSWQRVKKVDTTIDGWPFGNRENRLHVWARLCLVWTSFQSFRNTTKIFGHVRSRKEQSREYSTGKQEKKFVTIFDSFKLFILTAQDYVHSHAQFTTIKRITSMFVY